MTWERVTQMIMHASHWQILDILSSSSEDEDAEQTAQSFEDEDTQQPAPEQRAAAGVRQGIWFAETDNPLAGNVPVFTGCHQVNIHGDSPVDYFYHLFSLELFEEIVEQSNLYASQKGKDDFQLTVGELKTFLGVVLVMTYIKYACTKMYWNSEEGVRMDLIANVMSCNRWEDIRRYLHFVDLESIPPNNTDKLVRIRPVLKRFHDTFHAAVQGEEFQSLDEMLIPFKGRSQLKQYLPKKTKTKIGVQGMGQSRNFWLCLLF